MNKRSKYLLVSFVILSAILVFLVLNRAKQEPFKTEVFKTATGYGYSITYNNKLLIKQNNIPAQQNSTSFCSYQDAQKIADLVKVKLTNKVNPKISLLELKQLDIKLNCIN